MPQSSGHDRQQRVLTGDELTALLRFLDADRDRAAVEYERLRQRLMKLFQWRGCAAYEEYADRTLDRVARMIASGTDIHTDNPYALCHGVALNLVREYWRDVDRQRHALSKAPAAVDRWHPDELLQHENDEARHDNRVQCVRQCLARMPADSLSLIRRYYTEGDILNKEQRKRIAVELGLAPTALRVRAFRIRGEIGRCVQRCLTQGTRP